MKIRGGDETRTSQNKEEKKTDRSNSRIDESSVKTSKASTDRTQNTSTKRTFLNATVMPDPAN